MGTNQIFGNKKPANLQLGLVLHLVCFSLFPLPLKDYAKGEEGSGGEKRTALIFLIGFVLLTLEAQNEKKKNVARNHRKAKSLIDPM